GCREGFFMSHGSSQCFKLFNDWKRNWDEAKSKCEQVELVMAQPTDDVAVALRDDIINTYGYDSKVHLAAHADGSQYVWRDGSVLRTNNPLWWPKQPGSSIKTGYCLGLLVDEYHWTEEPGRPYWSWGCAYRVYTLCEEPMPAGVPRGLPHGKTTENVQPVTLHNLHITNTSAETTPLIHLPKDNVIPGTLHTSQVLNTTTETTPVSPIAINEVSVMLPPNITTGAVHEGTFDTPQVTNTTAETTAASPFAIIEVPDVLLPHITAYTMHPRTIYYTQATNSTP
ncbi:unnamed protein product, partial [Meganyctiphanes norvegica]